MPRYVILLHEMPSDEPLADGRGTHWDLMLEWGAVLRTWALPTEPAAGLESQAQQLADHRLAYLDYEGPVSGNRGHVSRWDAGNYRIESQSDRQLIVDLDGPRLPSHLTLQNEDAAHFWRVSFGAAPMRG